MSSAVLLGLGIAAIGLAGRAVVRVATHYKANPAAYKLPNIPLPKMPDIPMPKFIDLNGFYKGGFDQTMTKFEAGKILGVSPSAPRDRINDAHKRVIKAIHPDKGHTLLSNTWVVTLAGGSPYLAAKVNEAKRLLDSIN